MVEMRPILHALALALALVAVLAPSLADAGSCSVATNTALPETTVVPPRARLVLYSGFPLADRATATIAGKRVPVSVRSTLAFPFQLAIISIDSDRTGPLALWIGEVPLRYTVKRVAMPDTIPGVIQHVVPSVGAEMFEGLGIRLPPGTPAILAHVKIRADDTAPWHELDVPLYTPRFEARPMIRVGAFDCISNAPPGLLAGTFDLDVSVTLADGTTRPVTGLATRVKLPEPLPPQPRPKNRR